MKNQLVTKAFLELRDQLKAQSVDKHDFYHAVGEWHLVKYHRANKGDIVGACGKKFLKHVYTIKNMLNGNTMELGVKAIEHLFHDRYLHLMFYLKRTTETRNWVFTRGMIQYALLEGWVNAEDALLMERYITQKSRPSGQVIHDAVCQSTRKCLSHMHEDGGVDTLAIERILGNMPQ